MKFSTLACAAAMTLGLAAPAFAAGGSLGDISDQTKVFNSLLAPGFFVDTWSFTVTGPGAAASAAVSTVLDFPFLPGVEYSIAGMQMALTTGAFDFNNINFADIIAMDEDASNGLQVSGALLSAGSYKIVVIGTADGTQGGSYSGLIQTVMNPVPEPQTYALMLGGLAALAFLRRRRQD